MNPPMNEDDISQALWREVQRSLASPSASVDAPAVPIALRRRRSYRGADAEQRARVQLVQDDGVLRWVYEAPALQQRHGRRSYRSYGVNPRAVVQDYPFEDVGSHRITEALVALDLRLNPNRGLRRWNGKAWQPVDAATLSGRVLLLVHGTFSRGEMYSAELAATPEGRALWARWQTDYSAVLSLDHATLSVGPWINALQLQQALRPFKGTLDVLCHSRGGLVVSWALRLLPLRVRRVIYVGSPLMGTSLASPERLREALDLLANMAQAVAWLSRGTALAFPPALPLALGAAGLAQALGRVLQLGSHLPVPDAAVALVPGLMAQARVANNLERESLFADRWVVEPALSGVGVSFLPDESREPVWKFWKRFSHVSDQIKAAGADLIFQAPNDLVVDRATMFQLGSTQQLADVLDLGVSAHTHHCNYFRNAQVLDFVGERLRPGP
jgi:pimeloyl-ACP methyl ester carboxylesterase